MAEKQKSRAVIARKGEATLHDADHAEGETLSLDRIVEAAVELLDERGVGGLTMRRLADRLGSGVMSLYWHVHNKDDVFDLALDATLAERDIGSDQTDCLRDRILVLLEDWRAAMLRHPWSVALLPGRPLGPAMLDRLETLGRALQGAGIAEADLNVAIWSLWNYVMGATVTRTSFVAPEGREKSARRRDEKPDAAYRTIDRIGLLADDDWDGVFRSGLDRLLDGLGLPPARN